MGGQDADAGTVGNELRAMYHHRRIIHRHREKTRTQQL
jgi:hypothetical protein